MKKVIIIFLIGATIMGCRNNELTAPSEEAIEKSDNFLNARSDHKSNAFQYVILEALDIKYQPIHLGNAVRIHHTYSKTDIQKGILEYEAIASSLAANEKGELDIQKRADLQLITYLNLEHFIFNLPESDPATIAYNLKRLLKYTEPLETRILANALVLAKPYLKTSEYNSILNYIKDLNKKGFQHLEMLSDADQLRLKSESDKAILLINESLVN